MKNVRSFQLRHRTNFEISRPGKFKILQFHSGFALAHILSFHDDIILRNIFYCVRRRRTHTNHVVFRNQSVGFTRRSRVYRRDAIRFQGLDAILGGWMNWLCGTDSLDRTWLQNQSRGFYDS